MLAGHETTANALSWMWYLLAINHEARERMLAEVDEVLGGRPPTFADVDRLPWTHGLLPGGDAGVSARVDHPSRSASRTTRSRPPHPQGRLDPDPDPRACTTTSAFGRDPEVFDPTRFLPENASRHHRCSYLPFGAGRRVCAGKAFAVIEGTIVTAMMSQRFTYELVPGLSGRARGDLDAAAPPRAADDRAAPRPSRERAGGGCMSAGARGGRGRGRVLGDRCIDPASARRLRRPRPDRGGARRRRHLVLEPLSRRGRRHPVVQLPVLVRAQHRLVARVCPGPASFTRTPGIAPTSTSVRERVRFGTRVPRREVRRRGARVAASDLRRRRAHRPLRDRRHRRAHAAQAAGHPGPRQVRRRDRAHRALGSRARPSRQARRGDRHRRLGCPGDPRDRGRRGAPDRVPAHSDLVLAQARRAPARRRCAGLCAGCRWATWPDGWPARCSSRRRSRCRCTSVG